MRIKAVTAMIAALIAAGAPATPVLGAGGGALPVPRTVEEARARLEFLKESEGQVEAWVEQAWPGEFERRFPKLSRAARRPDEPEQAYRQREMRNRIAVGDLKTMLRNERREWLDEQRRGVLDLQIREAFPVRLGPYDAERGEYPLLLGFGWPAGLSLKLKVPEGRKDAFAGEFPRTVPAVFRVNEAGEAYLLSIDKEALKAETVASVVARGPSLIWRGEHESWVTAVSFRPDGAQAISGGGDGALCAWDVETGIRTWRLPDAEMALSVAHGPDSDVFATGGADSLLRLRDVDAGKELWRARASGMVFSVAFSPDGRFVATGDDGGFVRVWNARSGKEIVRAGVDAPVRAVAYAPDGRSIVAGSEGRVLVLWEAASGRQLWRVPFDGPVYAVAVNPAGDLVAAGGGGAAVRIFRTADGSEALSVKADGEVRAVRFDPSGRFLAYGGSGFAARVVLAETGEPMWTASIGSPVRALAFGPQGLKILVGSADFGVRLFAVDEGNRIQAAFSACGKVYVERADASRLVR
ncbi:MAG: WD40 repeat domain-containing protein [Gemmatimonadota bacterium]